jgi:hypothetical protein
MPSKRVTKGWREEQQKRDGGGQIGGKGVKGDY